MEKDPHPLADHRSENIQSPIASLLFHYAKHLCSSPREQIQIFKYFLRKAYLINKSENQMKLLTRKAISFLTLIVIAFIIFSIPRDTTDFPLHENIIVTTFWVGEEASRDNAFIQNKESAWDTKWVEHYGGVDDPNNRLGFHPEKFTPLENPFYFALPYSDFNAMRERRNDANEIIYWANSKIWSQKESMLKNRWIKISKGDKVAYAQWEDVGPFEINDHRYVFGSSKPKNEINSKAGLDISPAVRDYLELKDVDIINWKFINSNEVPDGPWTEIITDSKIFWE